MAVDSPAEVVVSIMGVAIGFGLPVVMARSWRRAIVERRKVDRAIIGRPLPFGFYLGLTIAVGALLVAFGAWNAWLLVQAFT